MKVAILYIRLLDADGEEQLIGGVETYLVNLGELCAEMGWTPFLFQRGHTAFRKQVGALTVVGVPPAYYKGKKLIHKLLHAACQEIDLDKDILIFGADHRSVPVSSPRCIAIQHGIAWDLPASYLPRKRLLNSRLGAKLRRTVCIRNHIRRFNNCRNRVCVDYNFLNWYRAVCTVEPEGRVWVIPNFAPIASSKEIAARQQDGSVRILFARRFVDYRGTRLMAEATKCLLGMNTDVMVTFAGEGPDETWLKHQFAGDERVRFTKYLPPEVMDIHLKHHIAVIPSIASEGTSLSVAEAMGAGCAVVATAVGGITNMIIDGYNGVLVMPDAESLSGGLLRVVEDGTLRQELGQRAYETARDAFCVEKWKRSWREVLEEVAHAWKSTI